MKPDPLSLPAVRVEFRLADGSTIEKAWSIHDGPPRPFPPPAWLDNPRRKWDHPQDAITISGDVKPGLEAEARSFVEGLGGTDG